MLAASIAMVWGACSAHGAPVEERPSLVLNGAFDAGLQSWSTEHSWYEQPQGSGKGTSRFDVDPTGGREGSACAHARGQDNRGILIQDVRIRPEPHRLSGWVRCQGLGETAAVLNIEWIGEGSKWLAGEAAGSVSGDADWTFVSRDVTPVEGAVVGRVECLTNANNTGEAWFDGLRLANVAGGDATAPTPASFRTRASRWVTGALGVDWLGYQAPDDIAVFRVRAQGAGEDHEVEVNGSARSAVLRGLTPGKQYEISVAPVDLYGNAPADLAQQAVVATEGGAPRVEVTPLVGPTGAIAIRLSPPLGADLPASYDVTTECAGKRRTWRLAGDAGVLVAHDLPSDVDVLVLASCLSLGGQTRTATTRARTLPALDLRRRPRGELTGRVLGPADQPIAGATVSLVLPDAPRRAATTDASGDFAFASTGKNAPAAARLFVSAEGCLAAMQEVLVGGGKLDTTFRLAPASERSWDLWVASPLAQVFQDAEMGADRSVRLLAGRNERECRQLAVRPSRDLADVRVVFEDLQQEGGRAVIAAGNLTARFVSYVPVGRNSTASPPEELVRQAPADFPDELSDDPTRSLAAGQTQPIFLSIHVPPDTPAGVYTGQAYLATSVGLDPVPITLEVLPLDFPDATRFWVVNWFSTDSFENRYALAGDSDEWWGMLREYARLFRSYHQNVVTVSPALCEIWVEADGSHSYDWTRFDRWCELFLAEGVRRLNITHLGGRKTGDWECPEFVLSDRPATLRATGGATTVPLEGFLERLQAHLEDKGWLELTNQHIADEPIPVNVESWKQCSDRVHRAAPKLKRMDAIHVPDLRGFCELCVPQLNYFDQWRDQWLKWRQAGEYELWFYIAWVPQGRYPNRLIDLETIKPRVVHWMGYLEGATGYLHWGLNHWSIPFGTFAPGDEWIVWPGRDGPNSSLRYEAQRDGLEDCEYLWMLEAAQGEVIRRLDAKGFAADDRSREIGRRVVRSMTDYTRSSAELQAAREEVLRDIVLTRTPPYALVRTEPTTAKPLAPGEVNVYGVTEPGCTVMVNGETVRFDGDRFLARVAVNEQTPEATVTIRKGQAMKTLTRRFRLER